jgi:hypothetical protein
MQHSKQSLLNYLENFWRSAKSWSGAILTSTGSNSRSSDADFSYFRPAMVPVPLKRQPELTLRRQRNG